MDFGQYGNTWWSRKWLETLLAGADASVVATGLRYAMREQVKSIDIVDNRVISVVKGPNGGLHNNYIVFPLFARERCEMFMSLLRQQPSEMLALNNKALNESIEILLAKSGLDKADVDYFVFHQANKYMLSTLRKVCGIPADRFYVDLEETGNTVSSTILIGLKECLDAGKIVPGMKVMVCGFGVGLSYGAGMLQF